jgi:hypothetical protein
LDVARLPDGPGFLFGLLALVMVPAYLYLHLTNRARRPTPPADREDATMPDDRVTTVYMDGRNCPRCGSPLATDSRLVWCTDAGSPNLTCCLFGIDEKVAIDDPRIPTPESNP